MTTANLPSDQKKFGPILIVEDDLSLAYFLRKKLETHGFMVRVADNGSIGLEQAIKNEYKLVILDINLPELHGLTILKRMRSRSLQTPVIVITGCFSPENEVKSFQYGANLFHHKPINFELLIWQAKSLVGLNSKIKPLCVGEITIDRITKQTKCNDLLIDLTEKEFQVFFILASAKGGVISREELLNRTFTGVDESSFASIDTHISRLRKKLGQHTNSIHIESVYGRGYKIATTS